MGLNPVLTCRSEQTDFMPDQPRNIPPHVPQRAEPYPRAGSEPEELEPTGEGEIYVQEDAERTVAGRHETVGSPRATAQPGKEETTADSEDLFGRGKPPAARPPAAAPNPPTQAPAPRPPASATPRPSIPTPKPATPAARPVVPGQPPAASAPRPAAPAPRPVAPGQTPPASAPRPAAPAPKPAAPAAPRAATNPAPVAPRPASPAAQPPAPLDPPTPEGFEASGASLSVDVPRVRVATGQFPPLPGERDEQPPPKPYPMRAAGAEGTSTHTPEIMQQKKRRRRAVLWIGGGAAAGLLAFVMLFLSPPPWIPYPFPAIQGLVDSPSPGIPPGNEPNGIWVRSGGLYLGSSANSIFVLDAGMGDVPEFTGELDIGSVLGDERPTRITLVSEPSIDGVVLSWYDGRRLHWRPLEGGADEELARTAPGTFVRAGEFIRRSRDEIVHAPVRLEDWSRRGPEKFVVTLQESRSDRFMIKLIDPTDPRPDYRHTSLEAAILAPPISFYDARSQRGVILVATRAGLTLYGESEGQLEVIGGGGAPTLPFPEPERWAAAGPAAWMKIRLGPGEQGWLLASAGALAIVSLGENLDLKIEAETDWEAGPGDRTTAPALLTYPDADRPEHDQAVICQKTGHTLRVSRGGGGNVHARRIPDLGGNPAAADINGDAIWDVIGIGTDGTVRVVDGASGERVEIELDGSTDPPGENSVLWTCTPESMTAFYISVNNKPVRIRIPFQWAVGDTWRERMERDRKWRLGMLPDQADTAGAG